MYIRWDIRPRKQDQVYRAVLVQGRRVQGRVRIERLGYLGSIRARWREAPAHRLAFWTHVTARLEQLVPDSLCRQRLLQHLAQRLPPPTPEDLQTLQAQRAWLAAWTPVQPLCPPRRLVPCPEDRGSTEENGHDPTHRPHHSAARH